MHKNIQKVVNKISDRKPDKYFIYFLMMYNYYYDSSGVKSTQG